MTSEPGTPAHPEQEVPETNRTALGLYVTPQQAYEMWRADPDGVNVVDVRTFEEYIFVGHLEMARNIPFVFPRYEVPDPATVAAAGKLPPGCSGEPNPDFVATVQGSFAATDTILVYCATGGRGAMAVNVLAAAGFSNVYNIVNGLEGDRVDDLGSVYHGKHMRNGWKNSGLPWGYDFHPDLMWVAAQDPA